MKNWITKQAIRWLHRHEYTCIPIKVWQERIWPHIAEARSKDPKFTDLPENHWGYCAFENIRPAKDFVIGEVSK